MRNVIYILALLLMVGCTNTFNKALKTKDNEFKLKTAEKFYAEKKYEKAQVLFEQVFPAYRGTPRFEDIYYKFCMCAYYQKDYANAENLLKTYVENFPSSTRAEEAEYLRAYSFYKQSPRVQLDQTATQKAMGLMQTYLNTHPNSPRAKEAAAIIDEGRYKMEIKEFQAAELYYNLGYYKAAAIAFATIVENYPDSERGDEYKRASVRSYFKYAQNSIAERQNERFQKVISEAVDFAERYPTSKFAAEVDQFRRDSQENIKKLQENEQNKKAA